MNNILHYYNLCILINMFMSGWFFIINNSDNVTKNVFNALEFIAFFNIVKIIIQFEITRRIRREMLFVKQLKLDIILDFVKIGYYTYMFIVFDEFFYNIKMYIIATLIGINYFIIFLQMIFILLSPEIFSTNTRVPLINTTLQEVHISFSNNIDVYSVSNNTNIICPICLEEQFESEIWTNLRCKHQFHYKCITEWLTNNRTCPTCRIVI